MAIRVDPETLAVLSRATADGNALKLPEQLERASYTRVARVIEAAGGKWNRKFGAHLFDEPAEDALEQVLLTGQITSKRQELGAFFTPPNIAARVIAAADLRPGLRVLEPSAGRGALAAPALRVGCEVDCVEIDPRNAQILRSTSYAKVYEADFLGRQVLPATYDRVVMNPPFARQRDVVHVRHAARFLKPGGRLVAIVSAGVLFRTDRRTEAFRRLIADGAGTMARLPDGAFRPSGTEVNTALVALTATPALLANLAEG